MKAKLNNDFSYILHVIRLTQPLLLSHSRLHTQTRTHTQTQTHTLKSLAQTNTHRPSHSFPFIWQFGDSASTSFDTFICVAYSSLSHSDFSLCFLYLFCSHSLFISLFLCLSARFLSCFIQTGAYFSHEIPSQKALILLTMEYGRSR